ESGRNRFEGFRNVNARVERGQGRPYPCSNGSLASGFRAMNGFRNRFSRVILSGPPGLTSFRLTKAKGEREIHDKPQPNDRCPRLFGRSSLLTRNGPAFGRPFVIRMCPVGRDG